jgi:hypothetical protein
VQRHLGRRHRASVATDEQGRVVSGGKTENGSPPAQPVQVGGRRSCGQSEVGELVGAHPRIDQGAGHPVLPGERAKDDVTPPAGDCRPNDEGPPANRRGASV